MSNVTKYVLIMVGLPARGKSCIAERVCRYLNWRGKLARVFNVGKYRRNRSTIVAKDDYHFFDPDDKSMVKERDRVAAMAMEDLLRWLVENDKARVGVHDATNSTRARRQMLVDICDRAGRHSEINCKLQCVFIESICRDPAIIEENSRIKLFSPDYRNCDREWARADFARRLAAYERAYEPVEEAEMLDMCIIQLFDVAKKILVYNLSGFIMSSLVFYLMNIHTEPRTIWLTRHGQSEWNEKGLLGGDSSLSMSGKRYAVALTKFIVAEQEKQKRKNFDKVGFAEVSRAHVTDTDESNAKSPCADCVQSGARGVMGVAYDVRGEMAKLSGRDIQDIQSPRELQELQETKVEVKKVDSSSEVEIHGNVEDDEVPPITIYTSTLTRTLETASHFTNRDLFSEERFPIYSWKMLDEIDAGECEGMTYEQILAEKPLVAKERHRDKLGYRYRQGESYLDVIDRVREMIIEMERQKEDILVIGHQAVLRCLYGYFIGASAKDIPFLEIPLHTVVKITPKSFGCEEERFSFTEVEGNQMAVSRGNPLLWSLQKSGGTSELSAVALRASKSSVDLDLSGIDIGVK